MIAFLIFSVASLLTQIASFQVVPDELENFDAPTYVANLKNSLLENFKVSYSQPKKSTLAQITQGHRALVESESERTTTTLATALAKPSIISITLSPLFPTTAPTRKPSRLPSSITTSRPSKPTVIPSVKPSNTPTSTPSAIPTHSFTYYPWVSIAMSVDSADCTGAFLVSYAQAHNICVGEYAHPGSDKVVSSYRVTPVAVDGATGPNALTYVKQLFIGPNCITANGAPAVYSTFAGCISGVKGTQSSALQTLSTPTDQQNSIRGFGQITKTYSSSSDCIHDINPNTVSSIGGCISISANFSLKLYCLPANKTSAALKITELYFQSGNCTEVGFRFPIIERVPKRANQCKKKVSNANNTLENYSAFTCAFTPEISEHGMISKYTTSDCSGSPIFQQMATTGPCIQSFSSNYPYRAIGSFILFLATPSKTGLRTVTKLLFADNYCDNFIGNTTYAQFSAHKCFPDGAGLYEYVTVSSHFIPFTLKGPMIVGYQSKIDCEAGIKHAVTAASAPWSIGCNPPGNGDAGYTTVKCAPQTCGREDGEIIITTYPDPTCNSTAISTKTESVICQRNDDYNNDDSIAYFTYHCHNTKPVIINVN